MTVALKKSIPACERELAGTVEHEGDFQGSRGTNTNVVWPPPPPEGQGIHSETRLTRPEGRGIKPTARCAR